MAIPKIIHYCWFGTKEIPPQEKAYIEGWTRVHPDFKVMFWNEQNFDLNTAVPYVKQAYEAKKFAFVSDYVRMYALNKYGGIYFDTDVELIKPIDGFFGEQFFIGFENKTMLGTGIIGSQPNMWLLQEMMDYYSKRPFTDKNGNIDTTTNVQILVHILEKHGFIKQNSEQNINGVHVFERDYFNPKKYDEEKFGVTDRTITVHHMAGSWLTERERRRGTSKFWRNVWRPILKRIRSFLMKTMGESFAKSIEVKLRDKMR